jgi:hypothetical protein
MSKKEGFFRGILDSLQDGVYFVDMNRRITYWNKGAERILPAMRVLKRWEKAARTICLCISTTKALISVKQGVPWPRLSWMALSVKLRPIFNTRTATGCPLSFVCLRYKIRVVVL